MEVINNVSLKPYNTFGMHVNAHFFASAEYPHQLAEILKLPDYMPLPKLLLGDGSNILFTRDFEGLVLKINFGGIKHEFLGEHKVLITAGAGEKWDALVQYCVNQNWGGRENLSLIPGSVGAAPIQNIGAYGVEQKDVFDHLEALDLETFEMRRFRAGECKFGYRDSVFKHAFKNRFLITSVGFMLSTRPEFNLSYPALKQEIQKSGAPLTLRLVADAVIRIRRSKLPDPVELGNAGSFFKNPVADAQFFESLKSKYPAIPSFKQADGSMKIPAAWLIEQCGWKGRRFGDAGVHASQALVLVNYGKASGAQILDLASQIRESVQKRYQIQLEPEVNIL
jgi:UDP-N-acetylmuramate dehydrogenase